MQNPIATVAALLVFCSAMSAQDSEERRKSLKGITGFYVSIENLDPAIEKEGLTTNQIRADVERRLRAAGINVLTKEQASQAAGRPLLRIDLMIGNRQGLYPYALDIGAHQRVRLERDPAAIVHATTWSVGSAGIANLSTIQSTVMDRIDEFINAWLSVNSRQRAAPAGALHEPEKSTVQRQTHHCKDQGFDRCGSANMLLTDN
jgi:hypothetical protein